MLVDADLPDLGVDSVTIDNEAAARMAVEHLLELGHQGRGHRHRRIGSGLGPRAAGRLQAGVRGPRDCRSCPGYISSGADTFEGGRTAAASLLQRWRRPVPSSPPTTS